MVASLHRFLVVALVLVGCGSSSSDVAPASDSDVQSTKVFDCRYDDGKSDGILNHFELGVGGGKARITDLSDDAALESSGKVDASYASKASTYQDATRYIGFADTADKYNGEVSELDLLTSKEIEAGSAGKAWVRVSGPDGGGTIGYACTKKEKALAVDTKRASRLACLMKPAVCPKNTCLTEILVVETAGQASAELTWRGSGGVVAKKESLGDAPFTRTTTTEKATWGTQGLDLKYRAGITYAGTFEIDGKKAPLVCNDVAMLD
jgi:hypothetical protein